MGFYSKRAVTLINKRIGVRVTHRESLIVRVSQDDKVESRSGRVSHEES